MVKESLENNQKSELNEKTKNNLKKVLKYNYNTSFRNTKILIWILILISLPLFKFNIIKETNLKFIIEKDKYIDNCTKDDIYKYEYNKTCYISCPKDTHISLNNKYLCEKNGNIFNEEYRYNSFNHTKYNYKQNILRILDDNNDDDEVDNIRKKITKGIINDTNREYIYMTNNIIFQITTLDYLYNNKNTKISSVNLGECENKIKEYYYINKKDELVIFKIDYYKEGILVPIVEYEIYDPLTLGKMDLTICSDITIEIYYPVSADINKEICITLCDDNCEYLNYDLVSKMYGCKCEVKNKIDLISEIEIQEWNSIEYFNKHCPIDDIINKIKNQLNDGDFESIIPDVMNGNDFIIKNEGVTFQITTSENQANNKNNNISTINLGECEYLLRNYYNIKKDEQLLIYKSESYKEGALVPTVEYEVYDINNNKLNLSICNDVKIDIEIPVLIDEFDLAKYDSSSEYYKDSCYAYTTESGTDITLEDRKKEFVNNNFSLCEENCELEGYDSVTKKIKCQCQTKTEVSIESDNYDIKDKLLESFNFNDTKEKTNIFKCVKLFFSKEGLISNIGSYIILATLALNVGLITFFCFNGTNNIQNEMNKALKAGNSIINNNINYCNNYNANMNYNNNYNMNNIENMNNNYNNNYNMNNIENMNNNNYINNYNMNNIENMNNNYNNNYNINNNNMNNDNMNNNNNNNISNDNNNNNENKIDINQNDKSKSKRKKKRHLSGNKNNNNNQNINNPPKKIKSKKKKVSSQNKEIKENIDSNYKSDSKAYIKNFDNTNIKENNKNVVISFLDNNNINNISINNDYLNNNLQHTNNNLNNQNYSDYELNNLNYYEAISIDQRTYFQYYYSLVKRKNIFIFSFLAKNDYNLREMKISLFFLSFCLFYLINSIFTNDSTIHHIYIDAGKFNLFYQLPRILYSILIVIIIIYLIKFLFLSDKNILEIKRVREQQQLSGKMNKIEGNIKCKTILYFITAFILKFFCWFYVGLFGAVFKNTQTYLIKCTLISFVFYLIYPFIYSLLPGLLRLSALNASNKDRAGLYKLSKALQIYI